MKKEEVIELVRQLILNKELVLELDGSENFDDVDAYACVKLFGEVVLEEDKTVGSTGYSQRMGDNL